MKFRTEVEIPISEKKIQISDSLFSIGSCFATEISVKLADSQFQTLNNPFGTLFNPWAVKNSIQEIFENKIYTEKDLDFHQGEYLSFNHHTSFNSENQKDTLRKINEKINLAHEFLKRSNWVIITYGTAFVYEHLAQNIFVANCHKIPQTNFNKRLLTHEELVNSIAETCHILKKICPKEALILFTLSPVRHTKDGFSENNLSKAKLL
ncbi:MAG: GSCFA domain-containing protein, partial [Riemerella sp.]|nr:GSCFA domain-containing protein [Riemerella sp.]